MPEKPQAAPKRTLAEQQITEPSTVLPGDAPADTVDPSELVSSRLPQPSVHASLVGTVNSAVKYGEVASPRQAQEQRTERYAARKPDGSEVTVEHNIDTGESRVV